MSMHTSFCGPFSTAAVAQQNNSTKYAPIQTPGTDTVASQWRARSFDGACPSAATIAAVEYNKPRAGLGSPAIEIRREVVRRGARRIAGYPEGPLGGAAALARAPAAIVAS